jgi:serine/threonine protein kinase
MFQNMTIKDLEMIRVLGIGGFGKVRLVKILETDQLMVLKTQSKKAILAKNMEAVVINEIQLMREMHHPYIAKLYGAFQDKCYIHMALELLQGGDFFGFLKHQNKFPEEKSIFYSSVVILALEALHSVKIAYRDLKPENLVFDKRGYIKLVDFGLAKRVKSGITWTLCGTPDYMAPEIVNNKGHGCPVDWWALGTIIYEMIDGYPPFYHSNQMKVYQRILSSEVKFSKHFSPDCRDFLTKLLNKNQTQRLGYVVNEGITEIQKHPWFRSIDWKKLLKGTMVPPFVPELKDPLDTSYFEEYEENVNDMYDSSQVSINLL